MSADNFHRYVKREMKKMDKFYDFKDFTDCVNKVGEYVTMACDDFHILRVDLVKFKFLRHPARNSKMFP